MFLITCINPCFNGRYSQRDKRIIIIEPDGVLILVLMEDTLREKKFGSKIQKLISINPCFNGRYSQRIKKSSGRRSKKRINPCFNGRYSQSIIESLMKNGAKVLILVLMEDTLRVILLIIKLLTISINPCFNGRYSQSRNKKKFGSKIQKY